MFYRLIGKKTMGIGIKLHLKSVIAFERIHSTIEHTRIKVLIRSCFWIRYYLNII